MPQGLALAYGVPVAASMPSLAPTASSPPLYEDLNKISSQLDKMQIQDNLIRQNQYRMMSKIDKAGENFADSWLVENRKHMKHC